LEASAHGIVNLIRKWKSFFKEKRERGKKRRIGGEGVVLDGSFPSGHARSTPGSDPASERDNPGHPRKK
jgi:hypothetical protein